MVGLLILQSHAGPQGDHHAGEVVRLAQAVDTADRRHHDNVPPFQQRAGGGQPQAVDLLVGGGVLFNIGVRLRHVGLRLVVVVVGNEILHRVVGKKFPELLAQLGGQRLVMGQHQRGPVDALDDLGHGVRLAAAGDALEHLRAHASTIAMAFDECAPAKAERSYVENSVARTYRWLERCKAEMTRLNSLPDTINKEQMLFGINQGAVYEDIRIDHAKRIAELDLPGYAIGGLAVGETAEEMYHILDVTVPYLPENKPVYLMGVGTPINILEAVDRGVDFFDCVYPSRNGRHAHVYTKHGKLNLKNAKYETDDRPIEEGCGCPACQHYSRGYIRHLLKANEMLGMRFCVLHNLYFYNNMMKEIRQAIEEGSYASYKKSMIESLTSNEV